MSGDRSKTAHLRRAVDLLEEGVDTEPAPVLSEESRDASMDMYSFEAAKRKQAEKDGAPMTGEIVISATDASQNLYASQHMKMGQFTGADAHSQGPAGRRNTQRNGKKDFSDKSGGPNSPRKAAKRKEADSGGMGGNAASQKMAGITWDNMPTMPRKRKSEVERMRFRKYDANGDPLTAQQELEDAQKELQDAIAEWTKQLSTAPPGDPASDDPDRIGSLATSFLS